ncbi:isochorismatase family protein [Neisseria sp. Ec49-e6-T10]|uniref:isochorismatase family protein n=1 Tax=Neisseria sp. Ec49-e6-T10 TaxID=3140744 RepID=UPI003EB958C2
MNKFTIENTALILIDHQVGTINWAGALTKEEREQVKVWTRVLARFAKSAAMPVVLTSSMEDQAQGLLLPELKEILPEAYENRIQRFGVINAWDDPHFANAVRTTGKKNLIMAGLTTEVCLTPPALSAKKEGFNVITLMDASGGNTRLGEQHAERRLNLAGIDTLTTFPALADMLGDWSHPASEAFFNALYQENVFDLLTQGNIR